LFNFYDQWQGRLIKRLDNLKNGQNFILVDKCQDLAEAGKGMDQDGYCMIIGRGDKHLKKMDLHGNIALTMQDLTDILHQKNTFRTLRIAHAGGWVDRTIFTNSLQALDHNLKRGFKYFELDLSYTKDRQLVCIHDFELTWKRLTRLQPQERPTLEMFQSQMRDHCKVTPCTIETLAAWMKKNPSAIIITDVKDDGYMEALKTISMKLPNFADRVIPQVFFPEDYAKAKQLGYKQVIWTLYRYNGTNEDVLKWVDTFLGPFAITMPKERALAGLSAQLAQKGIPSYVYTINDWKEAFDLMRRYKVTNIYTDLLPAN
jgi:glycerophosphoryl diester phosphodiesterase